MVHTVSLGIWNTRAVGTGGMAVSRELQVGGFSVLFLGFSLKIKVFVYPLKDGGSDLT